jgi:hypothetical protein
VSGAMARFQARSSIRPVVRAGFELLLVGVAVGMIVWAMVATVAVAREAEQASDLSYHQTIRELSQMLQGFTPDSVARVTTATHDVLGVSAAIDTLSVTIDPLNEPAFAVGGFVREQITAFNDAAIRQTVLTSAMGHDGTQSLAFGRSCGWKPHGRSVALRGVEVARRIHCGCVDCSVVSRL